jgi:hypothetical protein
MTDIQAPNPLADYVLINKAWFEQLDRYAVELSSDVENSQIFSEHEKTHIQLLNSTLYGYIKSSQTVVEQGQQLASLQNDRLETYKQTVAETRETLTEMQAIMRGEDDKPEPSDQEAFNTMFGSDPIADLDKIMPRITNGQGEEIGGEVPDVVAKALAGNPGAHQIPVTQAKENTEDGTTTPDTNEHSSGDAPEAQ